jgi:hypothetical protein
MDAETTVCFRYEIELALIASLDRAYYLKPRPTTAERAAYHLRQERLEDVRARLYAELRIVRQFEALNANALPV